MKPLMNSRMLVYNSSKLLTIIVFEMVSVQVDAENMVIWAILAKDERNLAL